MISQPGREKLIGVSKCVSRVRMRSWIWRASAARLGDAPNTTSAKIVKAACRGDMGMMPCSLSDLGSVISDLQLGRQSHKQAGDFPEKRAHGTPQTRTRHRRSDGNW